MGNFQLGLVLGIIIGVATGVVSATVVMRYIRYRRKHLGRSDNEEKVHPRAEKLLICVDGPRSSTMLSDSNISRDSPRTSEWSNMPQWLEGLKRKSVESACGIPKYSYKQLQKATCNFTTNVGEGAFGPVYKAQMETGQMVAVKVLANDSKQGAMEFLTEVLLLGRLHHRNLVNLVGYSAERGRHMLVYVYMSNGSLASHLYDEDQETLSWSLRLQIALDVARGLEYLHYGAVPPVVHRDIKSSNILLDGYMKARVADFGISRHEKSDLHSSDVKGTFGYVDPEYISTLSFTKKSDVYSFGVLLFEIMSGKNAQKGLMEIVEFVAIGAEDDEGWEQIADPRLDGKFDVQQLNYMAGLAYNCVNPVSRKRPSMREIVLALSEIRKPRNSETYRVMAADTTFELDLKGTVGSSLTER
ncbi:calcium/calmodulin-regulated receptor-like kinase 1 [Hibiscus trionum]|uniref:Calcium/calmodulin-regulated receptor-like kinase 1 n=1 Tax=Hibiscus trionum TaxID=183268 RepID=A0A9W7LU24_HIBTR|nr:calcium/calmodulin-regulated receptor-like kinase 1 [Hibiscus trionum]